ncbi:MAG: alpha hydrolase [Methanosarcinales archaeon]
MKVSVLFSAGKDSSLAALLLSPFFEIELITCNFNILQTWKIARSVAKELGFPHRVITPKSEIIEKALDIIMQDKYPNNAINYIHRKALEHVARECNNNKTTIIADGTRRDDRVPRLSLAEVQSIEDKYKVNYIRPLIGYGRSAVNILVNHYFEIEEKESEKIEKADYESELRELIRRRYKEEMIYEIFPQHHIQSRVIRFKGVQVIK